MQILNTFKSILRVHKIQYFIVAIPYQRLNAQNTNLLGRPETMLGSQDRHNIQL